jgi:hypothetical protein
VPLDPWAQLRDKSKDYLARVDVGPEDSPDVLDRIRRDPSEILTLAGMEPDPWQQDAAPVRPSSDLDEHHETRWEVAHCRCSGSPRSTTGPWFVGLAPVADTAPVRMCR